MNNPQLKAFCQELDAIWQEKQYLGRAEILDKIRRSQYNHNKSKAKDIDSQTILGTEILQANLTDALKTLIDSVGLSAKKLTPEPFIPPYFKGRENDFEQVYDKLFQGQNLIMLVNGQGGMGKSTFSAKYWQVYECHYQYMMNLYVGNGIADALLSLAQALELTFEDTMSNDKRLEQLLAKIQQLDKPCLLILDNVDNETDLRNNFLALDQCKNLHILLTSRLSKFKLLTKHTIGSLEKQEALEVFTYHYENFDSEETTLFYQVFNEVEGNTLVLELFAKNLATFNEFEKDYDLQTLLDDVQKSLLRLSKSAEIEVVYKADGRGLRYEKPETIILAMYDLVQLKENEQALLSVFAVLPPQNITYDVLKKLLQNSKLREPLQALVQKGWVDHNKGENSFKVSTIIQEIVRYKNQDRLLEHCDSLLQNVTTLYAQGTSDRLKNYWIIPFISSITKYLPKTYEVIRLKGNLTNLYYVAGELTTAKLNQKEVLDILEKSDFDVKLVQIKIWAKHLYAKILYRFEHYQEAIEILENCEAILNFSKNEKSEVYLDLKSNVANQLSLCHSKLKQVEESEKYQELSLDLKRDVESLINKSYLLEDQGKNQEAFDIVSEALELMDIPENQNNLLLATTLVRSAQLLLLFSDGGGLALIYLEKAKGIYENQPVKYPDKIYNLYHECSRAYDMLKDYIKALEYLNKALIICEKQVGKTHSDYQMIQRHIKEVKAKSTYSTKKSKKKSWKSFLPRSKRKKN